MRIWSIHPKYLDAKGIVALWREVLLAKNVLEGKTRGYKNHPQLDRFKATDNPLASINNYLAPVYNEAIRRGYNFSKGKIDWNFGDIKLTVTKGQLKFEFQHLLKKLEFRQKDKFQELKCVNLPEAHPLFEVVRGGIEKWEIIN
jgi:hypothetical protein